MLNIKHFPCLLLSALTTMGIASNAVANPAKTPCQTLVGGDSSVNIPDTVTCSFEQKNRIMHSTKQQPILVLNRIQNLENPMADVINPDSQLGLVEPGTPVKIIGETNTKNFMQNYTKVEILKGRLKGKIGWISTNALTY